MLTQKPRFLAVDDHEVVRQGLRVLLSQRFPESVVEEADSPQTALEKIWNNPWDVVLLDICIPGRGGLDLLRELKATQPDLSVVVLSVHPEAQYAIRALKLGAASYIRKEAGSEDLLQAVEAALRGERYITPSLAAQLASHVVQDGDRPPHETLSNREYEVLVKLSAGQIVKEVAAELNLSVKTVSTYRSRILEKTGLKNNSQLIRYAVDHALPQGALDNSPHPAPAAFSFPDATGGFHTVKTRVAAPARAGGRRKNILKTGITKRQHNAEGVKA